MQTQHRICSHKVFIFTVDPIKFPPQIIRACTQSYAIVSGENLQVALAGIGEVAMATKRFVDYFDAILTEKVFYVRHRGNMKVRTPQDETFVFGILGAQWVITFWSWSVVRKVTIVTVRFMKSEQQS